MNVNNNAIKRIMADVRSLAKNPSSRYSAAPLEDNVFEWHFSIRGPAGTDFEGIHLLKHIMLVSKIPSQMQAMNLYFKALLFFCFGSGGMYHGRILLPAEYPFKPPNFIFLTKTGRYDINS